MYFRLWTVEEHKERLSEKKSCKNAWERRNSKFQISFSLSFVVDLKSHALFPYMKDLFD